MNDKQDLVVELNIGVDGDYEFIVEEDNEYDIDIDNDLSYDLEENSIIDWKYIDYPIYKDDYIVTPKARESQVLETEGKLMKENLTVLEVPYFETSNEYGTTIYIASEV